MHGQAKVKTTEAEKEKKRKQREIKVKAYREGMEKFFNKRNNKEYDEEALAVLSDLLSSNPDIYSLWNFKKEIILKIKDSKSGEENTALLNSELRLTEACLRCNPKSYGAWFHRLWLLDNMPDPDLGRELELCTRYLKLDERNFHCWDYRRAVVARLGIAPAQELAYTMQKIEDNFSNYSSWHYRSKLLPLVHPDPAGIRPIDENTHLQELETVLNAAFTDPNDQSAWFYQRWLLGATGSCGPRVGPVHAAVHPRHGNAYLALDTSLRPAELTVQGPGGDDNDDTAPWTTLAANGTSYILTKNLNGGPTTPDRLTVTWKGKSQEITLEERDDGDLCWSKKPRFHPEFSPALITVLEDQLDSCKQLLALEPDSKWTLLTVALLMHTIDRKKFKDDIMKHLTKLVEVDQLRSAYYRDLRSRFIMENRLEEWEERSDDFSLIDSDLTALYHAQYLLSAKRVNFANNLLHRSLSQLYALQRCQVLVLDGNGISTLAGMPELRRLTTLSLRDNDLTSLDDIVPHLSGCTSLAFIDLAGNPIVEDDIETTKLSAALSSITLVGSKNGIATD